MYSTSDFRKNLKIEIDGVPYEMVEFQHVSPGKGSAFSRTRLRNLLNNNVIDRTFKSVEKVGSANIENREYSFLYKDSAGYTFMDSVNFEQIILNENVLKDKIEYLAENLGVQILFHNDKPIGLELPYFIESVIVESDPASKGDTVSGAQKVAKLATGLKVNVPLHLKEGDRIKVDTRTGAYSEKVNK